MQTVPLCVLSESVKICASRHPAANWVGSWIENSTENWTGSLCGLKKRSNLGPWLLLCHPRATGYQFKAVLESEESNVPMVIYAINQATRGAMAAKLWQPAPVGLKALV